MSNATSAPPPSRRRARAAASACLVLLLGSPSRAAPLAADPADPPESTDDGDPATPSPESQDDGEPATPAPASQEDEEPATSSSDDEAARTRAGAPGVLRAAEPAPGHVYEVRIEGARRIEPDALLAELRTAVGAPLDARLLSADVRRLREVGRLTDVVVTAMPGPQDSLVLVYRVEEAPQVRRIDVLGNVAVSRDDVDSVLQSSTGAILDVGRLQEDAGKIRALYLERGFHDTTVQWSLRKPGEGEPDDAAAQQPFEDLAARIGRFLLPHEEVKEVPAIVGEAVDVVFHIDEGRKVKVEAITLEGNAQVPTEQLTEVLRTKEHVPLADLLGWGVYREDLLETDVALLEALYQERGYLDVKVGPPRVRLSRDRARAWIAIPIKEGVQYRVGAVRIEGDLVEDEGAAPPGAANPERISFERADLERLFGLKEGDLAARSRIAQGIQAIADRYQNRGFAYVNIAPTPSVRRQERTVDFALRIEAGPRVRVERIEISGNSKTQDHVIRREVKLAEGEWFSAEKLRRSEERVRALGFFETIAVTTRPGTKPDRILIGIDVKERSTGTMQLGAGFSNAEGFIFTGQVAYQNFLGLGKAVSGSAQLSGLRRMFDLRLADPYFFTIGQEPISFSASVFNAQRGYIDFVRSSTGANFTFGYAVGRPFGLLTEGLTEDAPSWLRPYVPDLENLHLYLSANLERVQIEGFDGQGAPGLDGKPRYTTGLDAALVFDQRDNRLFPTAGYYLQARVEVASPWLGAALLPGAEASLQKALLQSGLRDAAHALSGSAAVNDFQRFSVNGRFYLNFDEWLPIRGVVAKANVELGYLRSEEDLPFESYYMGGIGTVRGYAPRTISPLRTIAGADPDDPARLFRIGGDKQLLANFELEFPLIEQLGLRGVLFFDAGNVYGRGENLFYLGMPPSSSTAAFDPRRDLPLGLYTSLGFGVRWLSPMGPLRFEWGIPLTPRPPGTPGMASGDQPMMFEFSIGGSF